jgi:hypothetical protein
MTIKEQFQDKEETSQMKKRKMEGKGEKKKSLKDQVK